MEVPTIVPVIDLVAETAKEEGAVEIAGKDPATVFVERVAKFRQEYIDNFFTKNPTMSSLMINASRKGGISHVSVNPRWISHPLYRPSLNSRYLQSDNLISTLICRSFSQSLTFEKSRSAADGLRVGSQAVSCMALDFDGALLATGNLRGLLSIYDVDEAAFSVQLR